MSKVKLFTYRKRTSEFEESFAVYCGDPGAVARDAS